MSVEAALQEVAHACAKLQAALHDRDRALSEAEAALARRGTLP